MSTMRHVVVLSVALACCASAAAAAAKPDPRPTVYRVPSSIKSNCSAPADAKLSAWLATVPDGSTVAVRRRTLLLPGRHDHAERPQRACHRRAGSEFRALTPGDSHRANWRFVNGSNVTQNLAVRGTDPQGTYDPAVEWQHGFSIEGVQGMTLSNVQARETWGDGIDLWRGAFSPACGDDAHRAPATS